MALSALRRSTVSHTLGSTSAHGTFMITTSSPDLPRSYFGNSSPVSLCCRVFPLAPGVGLFDVSSDVVAPRVSVDALKTGLHPPEDLKLVRQRHCGGFHRPQPQLPGVASVN